MNLHEWMCSRPVLKISSPLKSEAFERVLWWIWCSSWLPHRMGNRSVLVSFAVYHSSHRWISLANHMNIVHRQSVRSARVKPAQKWTQNENKTKEDFGIKLLLVLSLEFSHFRIMENETHCKIEATAPSLLPEKKKKKKKTIFNATKFHGIMRQIKWAFLHTCTMMSLPFQHKMKSCDNADTMYTRSFNRSKIVNWT